ncbi:unnamed protein product, partial [Ectocarpus sp. 4 AP-2014]
VVVSLAQATCLGWCSVKAAQRTRTALLAPSQPTTDTPALCLTINVRLSFPRVVSWTGHSCEHHHLLAETAGGGRLGDERRDSLLRGVGARDERSRGHHERRDMLS